MKFIHNEKEWSLVRERTTILNVNWYKFYAIQWLSVYRYSNYSLQSIPEKGKYSRKKNHIYALNSNQTSIAINTKIDWLLRIANCFILKKYYIFFLFSIMLNVKLFFFSSHSTLKHFNPDSFHYTTPSL